MLRNENLHESPYAPTMLLRTTVRRLPSGFLSAERTTGLAKSLPSEIRASEYRDVVMLLEEQFQPATRDDVTLLFRLAALTLLARSHVPVNVVGEGDPNSRAARIKRLQSDTEWGEYIRSEIEDIALIDQALATLRPDVDITQWRQTVDPVVKEYLDDFERDCMKQKEKAKRDESAQSGGRKPDFDMQVAFDTSMEKLFAKYGIPRKGPEPTTPDTKDDGSLDYTKALEFLTRERNAEQAEVDMLRERALQAKQELSALLASPAEEEKLTREQRTRIEKYYSSLESEMCQIERTLREHMNTRSLNSARSHRATERTHPRTS